jgi:hypothetical protein
VAIIDSGALDTEPVLHQINRMESNMAQHREPETLCLIRIGLENARSTPSYSSHILFQLPPKNST